MMTARIAVPVVAALCFLSLTPDASAFGRKFRGTSCCYSSWTPSPPCHPAFCLHARMTTGSELVPWSPDQAIRLPVEIGVTNSECYPWTYTNAEYGFYLFDDRGCQVPNAFVMTTELRTITVVPRATVLDQPTVYLAPGVTQLGRRYTVMVTLRGRSSCFHVTPVLFGKGTG